MAENIITLKLECKTLLEKIEVLPKQSASINDTVNTLQQMSDLKAIKELHTQLNQTYQSLKESFMTEARRLLGQCAASLKKMGYDISLGATAYQLSPAKGKTAALEDNFNLKTRIAQTFKPLNDDALFNKQYLEELRKLEQDLARLSQAKELRNSLRNSQNTSNNDVPAAQMSKLDEAKQAFILAFSERAQALKQTIAQNQKLLDKKSIFRSKSPLRKEITSLNQELKILECIITHLSQAKGNDGLTLSNIAQNIKEDKIGALPIKDILSNQSKSWLTALEKNDLSLVQSRQASPINKLAGISSDPAIEHTAKQRSMRAG